MAELQFVVRGRVVGASDVERYVDKGKPRPKRDAAAAFHRGWAVEGHEPGAIERAREAHKDVARPFIVESWLATTRRKRIGRVLSTSQAAGDMKALAERNGWTHVQIVELSKGQISGELFG